MFRVLAVSLTLLCPAAPIIILPLPLDAGGHYVCANGDVVPDESDCTNPGFKFAPNPTNPFPGAPSGGGGGGCGGLCGIVRGLGHLL